MDFCIVDLSTSATATEALGGPLTAAVLETMAAALEIQANRDVAPYWGGSVRVRAATAPGDGALPTEIACVIVDDLSVTAPGADAYHAPEGSGSAVIYVGRAQCSSVVTGASSISASLSHEIAETIADLPCNASRDAGDGWLWHQEIADPTQEDSYVVTLQDGTLVSVSNFVLPAFFDPTARAPFDFMGLLSAPFTLRPGGYITRRPTTGGDVEIFGRLEPGRLAKKRHPSSRTFRRGGRVAA